MPALVPAARRSAAEGLPLPLAAVNVGQSDDDQSFLVLKRVA